MIHTYIYLAVILLVNRFSLQRIMGPWGLLHRDM